MKSTYSIIQRLLFPSALLFSFLLMFSCAKNDPVPQNREPGKIELTTKSAELIEADHQFAFEVFKEVSGLSDAENLMISPLSVSYALGMTLNGADGTTRDAFRDVLHFGDLTDQEVNEGYKDLMSQLVTLDDNVTFSIANSIWYRLGYNVLQEFIDANRDYFDAAVEELDFSDPQAVDIINGWIEEKTNDKIRDMLDYIPADAVMYLINAIYFNATWKYQFDVEDTYSGNFTLENGSAHQAEYMQVEGGFGYTNQDDFTAVELPYGDSAFSMLVLLPKPGITTSELVEQMDGASWDSWFEYSYNTNVHVQLPKFKYGFKSLLNDPLTNLGLGVAFTPSADFTRITPPGGLMISRVIHQTFIDVKEEGTEAAAATIVEIIETSAGGGGPIQFKVDRPFLYVIKENSTGAILFMGKVGKPEYGE